MLDAPSNHFCCWVGWGPPTKLNADQTFNPPSTTVSLLHIESDGMLDLETILCHANYCATYAQMSMDAVLCPPGVSVRAESLQSIGMQRTVCHLSP